MIGKRIRTLRTNKNMSIDELASKLGKNRATVYRYEKGDIENLPLDILEPLAKALDTTPAYLMGWDGAKELRGTRITKGDKELLYFTENPVNLRHFERWHEEFGVDPITAEEREKIIEYAKFLIYLRDKQ